MILVIFGPGGAGKGTVVRRVVERDPNLWLSRSWTTRAQRPGEADDAYVWVDRERFERHAAQGGFLEWAEFLGHLYGTPLPDPPPGRDVVLEIDLQGARQIDERFPDARFVLLVPPSPEVQAERLRARGDPEDKVQARVAVGREEEAAGRALADAIVVNDDLDRAVEELAGIVEAWRSNGPR